MCKLDMEYKLQSLPQKQARFTIGLLDEDAYDEYHDLIVQGMSGAAQKHDVNIIRFAPFAVSFTAEKISHEDILLEFVKQFKLDGLIFLGWARVASNKAFRSIFEGVPLLSMASDIKGIPSVFFSGDEYIQEILLHLLHVHKLSSIAFIAPFVPDARTVVYKEIMQRYGIYNPQLYICEMDLLNLDVNKRGKRAVEILIDERKVKFDAIVSLDNDETYGVMNELKARGIRVPDDVAVTSYEDGEISRFSSPAYTTVYFPWKELGFYACDAMYKLLSEGHVPMRIKVPGRVVYRDSCGCIPNSSALPGDLFNADKCFEELNEQELAEISEKIAERTFFSIADVNILMAKFRQALFDNSDLGFMMELEIQLRKIDYNSGSNRLNSIATAFRSILLPYFLHYAKTEIEKLVWAENLFLQLQMMLQGKLANVWFRDNAIYTGKYKILKEIGQILVTNFVVKNLMDSLETNLVKLGIKGCFVYIFNDIDNGRFFDDYCLELEYSEGKRIKPSHNSNKKSTPDFKEVLFKENRAYFLSAHLLYIGNDFMGFVLFEPTLMDLRLYYSLGLQISTALNGAILFEKLDTGYKRLIEKAHRKGMAEISTGILHNIGNLLNSVNASIQSLHTLLGGCAINDLVMANAMLERNFDDLNEFINNNPKGKLLMQFYVSMGDEFEIFRSRLQSEIERLADKIGLIDEIITAQQNYTGVKSSLKSLELIPIIEDVLKMYQSAIEKHGIKVVRKYGRTAVVLVQRTKLYHVLTNLIKNAMESVENAAMDNRTLTVTITQEGGNSFICISDTGGGIAQEHLESIFSYGFTTKKEGHGFGLHSCANYMTEMDGRIWAENSIDGEGATFVLQLKTSE